MSRSVLYLLLILCAASAVLVCTPPGQAGAQSAAPVLVQVDPDGVQRATIVLDSYSYSPNHLVVQSGKPVELILTSVTTLTPHNFLLKEPAAGLDIEKDVGAGKSLTVRFTPTQPGTFTFYCDKKLLFFKSHREKGMEGRLEVR
ncbi:MAG: cupredoxin domain-containing protein [Nitrospiraceae bacterium]